MHMINSPYDKILKALLPGKSLNVEEIAAATGETGENTCVYLGDLLKRRLVVYTGDPFGPHAITEPGICAASQSISIPFALLQDKLEQPDPDQRTVIREFVDGKASFATKASFQCGCEAYRDYPPITNLALGINPCASHAKLIEGL